MLTHLVIRNFAIIEHLEIPFHAGFTVLSGETGAGKSIIIDALNLLLGGRATADIVRTDETQAMVEGIFTPRPEILSHINAMLDEQGIMTASEIIIRRIVSKNGPNKVFINGSLTTVSALAGLTQGLVDISGQHEHYSLLRPEGHIDILDNFADNKKLLLDYAQSYRQVSRLEKEKKDLEQDVRSRLHRIDFLTYQLEEINAAQLVVGEEEELIQELNKLKNAEKITEAVSRAAACCYDMDRSAAEQLAEAVAALERVAEFDHSLALLTQRLNEVRILTDDIARDLRHFDTDDMDTSRLNYCIERLDKIKKLRRKYGMDIEQLLAEAEQMRLELERLQNSETRGQELDAALASARSEAFDKAMTLSQSRKSTAKKLQQRIEIELAELNMARTQFIVDFQLSENQAHSEQVSFQQLSTRGIDRVEFKIATNLGEEPKPLAKIASGGELSRIMLAMKSVLMEKDLVETYIFDEVDTGIGGSTADVVGEKIQRTANNHQVLCITHLPQIASRSDHHYLVEKQLVDDRTQSIIRPLSSEERVDEIARMLGGTRVTLKTRDAARELLASRP